MDHSVGYSLHDLLPADVVGTMIYNIKQNEFDKKGPILPISFWQMRSTERQLKCSRLY
jgi:hypothetical protein